MANVFLCTGCNLEFNELSNIPKVLNCGHSVCSPCIKKKLAQNQSCPNCRKIIAGKEDSFPVNFSLLSLMIACESYSKNLDNDTVYCVQKLKEKYTTTKDYLSKKESFIKSELEVIENGLEHLEDLSDSEYCNNRQENLKESLITLEENHKKVNDKILSDLGIPRHFATISLESFKGEDDYLREIYSKLKNDEKVFAVERIENGLRFAQLSERDNMILMHSFSHSEVPKNTSVIWFSELRRCFFKKKLYTFLKVSTSKKDITHLIIIEMFWNSTFSYDFVKLCTGECGPSYKNSLYGKGLDMHKKAGKFGFVAQESHDNDDDKKEESSVKSSNSSNAAKDNGSKDKVGFPNMEVNDKSRKPLSTANSVLGSKDISQSTKTSDSSSQGFNKLESTKSIFGSSNNTYDQPMFGASNNTFGSSFFGASNNKFGSSFLGASNNKFGQPQSSGFFNSPKTTPESLDNFSSGTSISEKFNGGFNKVTFKRDSECVSDEINDSAKDKTKSDVLKPAKLNCQPITFNLQSDKIEPGIIGKASKDKTVFEFQSSVNDKLLASNILRVERSGKENMDQSSNFEYYHKSLDLLTNYLTCQKDDIIVIPEVDYSFSLFHVKQICTFKSVGRVIHPLNLNDYISYEEPSNLKVLDCGILFEM